MLPKGRPPAVEPNSKVGERGDDTVCLCQVRIEWRGSGQNDDSLSASRPGGGNVRDRVADHNDLSRAYSDRVGEGKHTGDCRRRRKKRSHRRPDQKVRLSQANSGCMLFGARRVRPVVVGWLIANRPLLLKPITY